MNARETALDVLTYLLVHSENMDLVSKITGKDKPKYPRLSVDRIAESLAAGVRRFGPITVNSDGVIVEDRSEPWPDHLKTHLDAQARDLA